MAPGATGIPASKTDQLYLRRTVSAARSDVVRQKWRAAWLTSPHFACNGRENIGENPNKQTFEAAALKHHSTSGVEINWPPRMGRAQLLTNRQTV
jgi:hypothetical protein